jgi:hypothetical protein
MNFGDIKIDVINYNYTINENKSPFFNILLKSLQLPFHNSFFSNEVYTLEKFIKTKKFNINIAENMLFSLYNQINILHNNNISISYVDLSDILVIDDNHFFILNINKFYIIDNNKILITDIYDKNNPFLSPLFLNNNSIPFTCHKNDFLFSLALILIDCFRQSNYLFTNLSNESILDYYKYTKIYQTLKLCLNPDISNRLFIIF